MEKYSYNQAEVEAELIRKKALKEREERGESGEPENSDYSEVEKRVAREPYFLREGREKWLEIVHDYWENFKNNHEIEVEAEKEPESKTIIELIKNYNKGVGQIHHRLKSTLGCFYNDLEESNLFTSEQLTILQSIVDNSSQAGKINRYSTPNTIERVHPVYEIYSKFFDNKSLLSDEEFKLLKEDALSAGASTALSTSPEEFLSWFHLADDSQNSKSKKFNGMLITVAQMSTEKRTEEENELIRQARLPNTLSNTPNVPQEKLYASLEISKEAKEEWLKSYFLEKFTVCKSFSDYIKKD